MVTNQTLNKYVDKLSQFELFKQKLFAIKSTGLINVVIIST